MTALVERHGSTPPPHRATHFSVLVVAASPFVRESLARSLRSLGAGDISEAGSLSEARVRARAATSRDLVVIDGSLPDGAGINLVRELRSMGWARGVLLSSSEDPFAVRAALSAGVRGFLVSTTAAAAGRALAGDLPTTVRRGPVRATGAEGLSGREVEVLQLVADGKSNKDIGSALGLSALTVKSHLARIARKLGTGDRAEMVVVAMRANVVA